MQNVLSGADQGFLDRVFKFTEEVDWLVSFDYLQILLDFRKAPHESNNFDSMGTGCNVG